ncbi:Uncharacterized protein BM_BM793 [Brugia malayi]|uniref:Caprin-1 dimerization domain-containing protein n=3 Tax=Brugia malayi TaxID=6279 RepID=A0A4E9FQU0_BRUMA|nr:Uncharacterized protein BM_BM793 [Brugia malayi]VIO99107.1 Uncharacterized protein BM_BM793 [Brugia malayi]
MQEQSYDDIISKWNSGNDIIKMLLTDKIQDLKEQIEMLEMGQRHLSAGNIACANQMRDRKQFVEQMIALLEYKEIIANTQIPEISYSLASGTNGAIKLNGKELTLLNLLHLLINPTINFKENNKIRSRKLKIALENGIKVIKDSSFRIIGHYTGHDIKCLLDRVRNCQLLANMPSWLENMIVIQQMSFIAPARAVTNSASCFAIGSSSSSSKSNCSSIDTDSNVDQIDKYSDTMNFTDENYKITKKPNYCNDNEILKANSESLSTNSGQQMTTINSTFEVNIISMENQCSDMISSDPAVEIKIFKPFDKVEELLRKRQNSQKKRYLQLMRWRQELKSGNALVEHYVRTDYKLIEAKAQLDLLNELVDTFYDDMIRLKEVIVEQRENDQKEFTKRMVDIIQYKEIVKWLQQPKIREAFCDGTNKAKVLNEEEMLLLKSLREVINPRISSYNYEKIWKRVLRDAAKLGMKLDSDEDERAIGIIIKLNLLK